MKVLVVDHGSMCPRLFGFINSRFQAERHPSQQALETLGTSGGFDFVISYVHKNRHKKDEIQLQQTIAEQFQHLPRVCFKCISAAVECFDELERISDSDLIRQWLLNTSDKKCRMDWTKELNFIFFDVVESLGGNATPTEILRHMVEHMDVPELTITHISSHLQKYRDLIHGSQRTKKNGGLEKNKRKNKIAKHYEEYLQIRRRRQLEGASSSYNSQHGCFVENNMYEAIVHPSQNGVIPMFDGNNVGQNNSSSDIHMVMPSTAPAPPQHNGQLHDTLGTSQQSFNQHYSSSPPQLEDDNNKELKDWVASLMIDDEYPFGISSDELR